MLYRAIVRSRQRQIGYDASYAPVAVFKGMEGDEPEMDEPAFKHGIDILRRIEPA